MNVNYKKAFHNRGKAYEDYLNKPYLHDQRIERFLYINHILFIDMYCECIEFHDVNDFKPIEDNDSFDWLYHEVKMVDERKLLVRITLTKEKILEIICSDFRIFNKKTKNYYYL